MGRYRPFIITGSALISIGMVMLTRLDVNSSSMAAVAAMVVIGMGIGSSMPIVNLILQNSVPHHLLGVVSSSAQFFRQIGGTLGVAVFGTLVTNHLQDSLNRELGSDLIAQTPPNLLTTLEEPRTLLNPDSLDRLEAGFAALGPQGAELYTRAVDAMRIALSDSLGVVFVVSAAVTGLAFIASFLMPEPSRPLRRSWSESEDENKPVASRSPDSGRFEGEPAS